MGLYTLNDQSFYFVHIPRTSGRYVRALIEDTPNIECKHNEFGKDYLNGKDVYHLHHPLYEYHFAVEDIPQIAIVRNPLDRFISAIRFLYKRDGTDFNLYMETKDDFERFIYLQNDIFSFKNNWFLPQYRFISPRTKIWKYEDGMGQNFVNWVYENTNIKISDNFSTDYIKLKNEKNTYRYPIDEHVKNYAYEFYYEDFRRFGYEYTRR